MGTTRPKFNMKQYKEMQQGKKMKEEKCDKKVETPVAAAAGEPSLIGKDGKPKTAKQLAKEKAKAEKAAKFAAKQARAKQQQQGKQTGEKKEKKPKKGGSGEKEKPKILTYD